MLVPAAAMVLVDARRRPVAATLAYATVLFAVFGWRVAGLPAFRPVVPGLGETALALGLTLAAAAAGGLAACRVAGTGAPED